jgi:predicted permease
VRYRAQAIFVVVELALALVLLIGAGLTVRSLARLWNVNRGFNPQNVLTFDLAFPPSTARETPDQVRATLRQLPDSIAQIPGVAAASLTDASMPLSGDWEEHFWLEGKPKPLTVTEMPETLFYMVSPSYLRVMGIPLLRGRFFAPQDSAQSRRVGVIDENFAREYFPNEDPIGRRIMLNDAPLEIIGIVGHVDQWGVDSKFAAAVTVQLYTPAEQVADAALGFVVNGAGIVVRTQALNYPSADTIRSAMQQMNSDQAVYDLESMDQVISNSFASRRFAMVLLGVFALTALLLASVGVYGVISYVAGQRTHEIGIRMVLGAQRRDVLKLVMSDAARMTVGGVLVGLMAAAGLTRLIKSMLFGVSTMDPVTFVGVAILLTTVAFVACYLPTRRAMRVDPIVSLRYE